MNVSKWKRIKINDLQAILIVLIEISIFGQERKGLLIKLFLKLQWAVYYTGPQSFKILFSYSFGY